MDEQWKAPWTYGWEIPEPAPPQPMPAAAPPPAGRRAPRAALGTAAAVLSGVALLGGLLATCGPGGSGSGELTGVLASAAPPSAPVAPPPAPSAAAPSSPAPASPVSPAGAAPSGSPADGPSPSDPAAEDPAAAPAGTGRPSPARTTHRPHTGTRPRATATAPAMPSIKVCAEAERQGHWPPGSEQARICRNLYGG
ncbi:hypothetical protein [Kitasatospora sp. NPDC085879]|uniref:hypothetical protein n=1 Tax=Kitasatospora sp. NPDC085879 TaxID=3154769 RepID=UPI003449D379